MGSFSKDAFCKLKALPEIHKEPSIKDVNFGIRIGQTTLAEVELISW